MRAVITTLRFHPDGLRLLTERQVEVTTIDQEASPSTVEALVAHVDPHAIISRGVELTARAIASAPSLRVIAKTGSGVDNIDIATATKRGIPVLSNVGANSRSLAEHALALMFAAARNIPAHDSRMRAGHWSRFDFQAEELAGKTLGLVGLGQSARILATLAAPLGMKVIAWAPRYRDPPPAGVATMASLAELLAAAHIISLHCPLTAETRGMIDAAAVARMRRGTWIFNTSRGAVIDEAALIEGLRSGQIARAGLDVHWAEPTPPSHPLFDMANVVLTAHVGGTTIQSHRRTHTKAAENVLAVLEGRTFDHRMVVNGEVLGRRTTGGVEE